MTAEQYLDALIAKNPAIGKPDNETITLTARGLRAIIRQAHNKGVECGIETSQQFQKIMKDKIGNPFGW